MFLKGEKLISRLDGIIHEGTQVNESGLDLTVDKIFSLECRGDLDFGGGERKDSGLNELIPEKRKEEDDYGWWELEEGLYIIEYNEEPASGEENIGLVVPLERLLRNGGFHPSVPAENSLSGSCLLIVGKEGLALKENARISRLVAWR